MRRPRVILLGLHRYVGLTLAAFLLLAGPTGSVAAFHDALDGWLNPDLFRARTVGPTLPPDGLAARLVEQMPEGQLGYLVYRPAPGDTVRAYLQPAPGAALRQNEIFLDPVTGLLQGARDSGGCCFGRRVLIPFLYRFHYSLGLGRTGILLMGVVAVLWSLDCLVGLLLTLPVRFVPWRERSWRKWGLAWRIEPGKGGFRRIFDLHRAFSLWLWIVLLGVAISGVSLNLPTLLFQPVVSALLPTSGPHKHRVHTPTPSHPVSLDQADRIATAAAARSGWPGPPGSLFVLGGTVIFYFDQANGQRAAGLGGPTITIDRATGEVLRIQRPGHGKAGDVVEDLQFPWHSGAIAGLSGRIVIAITGLVIPILVITGILIWQRKRHPKRRAGSMARRSARQVEPVRPS